MQPFIVCWYCFDSS